MKYAIIGALILASLLAYYNYTHTTEYVTTSYEDTLTKKCGSDLTCQLGAALIEKQVVVCMKGKFLSTSYKTVEACVNQVIDEINKK